MPAAAAGGLRLPLAVTVSPCEGADTVLAMAAVPLAMPRRAPRARGLAGGFPMPVMRRTLAGRRANPARAGGRAGGRGRAGADPDPSRCRSPRQRGAGGPAGVRPARLCAEARQAGET